MAPKVHPADHAAARIIAAAERFEIALFRGQGVYAKAEAASLDEARTAAARLEAEAGNGKRAMIYALTAEGRSALVTPATLEAMETNPVQTYSKKFNACRAAERAGIPAERIAVTKTADGYVWRDTGPKAAATESAPAPSARAKPAPALRSEAPRRQRTDYDRLEAEAHKGLLPAPPDFSAATHARFRGKLAKLVDLAAAGDIAGLRAFEINPVSSSPRAMARYRDLCVIALEVRAEAAA
ncbi:hypothetical protein M1105_19740 [Limibaculum sp. FT325]|uniref:hypothetical protein n=1 Tax=Thermohalobaculum sediminis TaxID=2939436 RepID=UPI0020BE2935|nr:hypothetical protein [Limibaculum sediminis]MCL5779199.1 hypothetical protein [Limibaculum sediminis]